MIKINMGCGHRHFGEDWVHIDGGNYEHLDYYDIENLEFQDGTVDLIYASHLLEYMDRVEVRDVLAEWRRVLKPGGILRLAVPNFRVLAELYTNGTIGLERVLGPLYGRMQMRPDYTIYHRTTYDLESLKTLLTEAKFRDIENYNWRDTEHADFDDHSQAYIPHMDKENGVLISLNVECKK